MIPSNPALNTRTVPVEHDRRPRQTPAPAGQKEPFCWISCWIRVPGWEILNFLLYLKKTIFLESGWYHWLIECSRRNIALEKTKNEEKKPLLSTNAKAALPQS